MNASPGTTISLVTPDQLRQHWQELRRLTRRVIASFPEDQLFTFSIGGMRTAGELALELLAMDAPFAHGVATGEWKDYSPPDARTRDAVLRLWDQDSAEIDRLWASTPPARFGETMTAFGQYTGTFYSLLSYIVDNENHHRGQMYVYLRALGVEPPPFWERD